MLRRGSETSRSSSGRTTGRDGIGGVSVLASAGFESDEVDDQKRPSVQVGDPFEEKRLIEASLELLDRGLVVGIQDLGGAGLTCATSETAARAGNGMDVDVSAVPLREQGMAPVEIMTSESQERMLAIVEPGFTRRRARGLRALGGPFERGGQGDRRRTGCASSTARAERSSPTYRPRCSLRTRPLRPTLAASPKDLEARRAEAAHRATEHCAWHCPWHRTRPRAPTTFSRCSWTPRGSTASTTTSCS